MYLDFGGASCSSYVKMDLGRGESCKPTFIFVAPLTHFSIDMDDMVLGQAEEVLIRNNAT